VVKDGFSNLKSALLSPSLHRPNGHGKLEARFLQSSDGREGTKYGTELVLKMRPPWPVIPGIQMAPPTSVTKSHVAFS